MAKKTAKTDSPPLSDTNWQARSDANTLREAKGITGDPKRHQAAKVHAKTEADAFRKVAGRKTSK